MGLQAARLQVAAVHPGSGAAAVGLKIPPVAEVFGLWGNFSANVEGPARLGVHRQIR